MERVVVTSMDGKVKKKPERGLDVSSHVMPMGDETELKHFESRQCYEQIALIVGMDYQRSFL